ncbi:MAG: tRNA pseudouridine(38-40) synthase TruA, partial [Gemmatimonadota bacterium]
MAHPPDGERRVRLTLQYDGGGFHGWQVQPDVRTVQGEIERAVARLTGRDSSVLAAGRTDAGVHAAGQIASVLVPERWTARKLRRSLNAVLPDDVWVVRADEVPASFNARFDAVARRYVYRVGTRDAANSPFRRRWCWPLQPTMTIEGDVLAAAAGRLPGERSFAAFAKAGQPERGDRCIVHHARWTPWRDLGYAFDIAANRFLHRMVRYLVGTMVDVASGRRPMRELDALLSGAEPAVTTSAPAPPEGLFLARVYYDEAELESETTV